jgi:hypothetical protein
MLPHVQRGRWQAERRQPRRVDRADGATPVREGPGPASAGLGHHDRPIRADDRVGIGELPDSSALFYRLPHLGEAG